MNTAEEAKLEYFFKENIIELDDDEVDEFLNNFAKEVVLQILSKKLKSIARAKYPDEVAWRLGRTFGDISDRYSADSESLSWMQTYNLLEKKVLLNFLSGYWDRANPNFDTLLELLNTLTNMILNHEWSQELVRAGIDAVTNGYSSLEYHTEVSLDIENIFREKLKIFESHLSNSPDMVSGSNQTLDFVRSVLNK